MWLSLCGSAEEGDDVCEYVRFGDDLDEDEEGEDHHTKPDVPVERLLESLDLDLEDDPGDDAQDGAEDPGGSPVERDKTAHAIGNRDAGHKEEADAEDAEQGAGEDTVQIRPSPRMRANRTCLCASSIGVRGMRR